MTIGIDSATDLVANTLPARALSRVLIADDEAAHLRICLLYTSPSPRD